MQMPTCSLYSLSEGNCFLTVGKIVSNDVALTTLRWPIRIANDNEKEPYYVSIVFFVLHKSVNYNISKAVTEYLLIPASNDHA